VVACFGRSVGQPVQFVGGLDERRGEPAAGVTADAGVRVDIDRNPAIRPPERVEPNMISGPLVSFGGR
jgi:hypothetical protein